MAFVWASTGLALAVALGAIVATGLSHPSAASGSGGGSGADAAAADLLQLAVVPPPALMAPDFTLTDQHGRPASVAQLRGKAVVLSFNDDECTDLCTLLAQDVTTANADLGAAAKDVVFLSVNANPLHTAVADVASWTDGHGLGGADNWAFATGTASQLAQVADSYHVSESVDPTTHDVTHGVELFFIDPTGREVSIGQFGTASANTALFGHAMAQTAMDLLPAASRTPVTGATESGTNGTATLHAPAPELTLPELGKPSDQVSLAGTHGSYTVVNFWASTCSACVQEMPDLEKAHQALGSSVTFLGVDVADTSGHALAFAHQSGVTYRLVADANGTAAGTYRIPGLPFTAIIGPDGTVLVRHPGTFTAEQLEYIIRTLQQG